MDSHHRQAIALAAGVLSLLFTHAWLLTPTRLVLAWNIYALCALALAWCTFLTIDPRNAGKEARLQDSSRSIIFVIVVCGTCASLLAVGFLLGPAKGLPPSLAPWHILLSVVAVVASWLLMHTVFAIHYAHLYYGDGEHGAAEKHAGSLEFPGSRLPDYLDFAYFSFVIGMTCQVSDVQISSRSLRRLALLQGLISFAFNTVILALSISVISGLLS